MKRILIVVIALVSLSSVHAQNEWGHRRPKPVNFGIRAGFNSSMYLVSDLKIKDVTIHDYQNNYKIGYSGAVFMRVNFQRHYLQPEISYQISRCEIAFDKLGSQLPIISPDYASITSKIHCVEFPVLYGYNIVKRGPYGLSVFAGPKIKYIWGKYNKISFDNFDQQDIHEELHPLNISVTVGTAVTISRIFFDFRYELGLNNISKSITYNSLSSGAESEIIFDRRENVLSFSLGFIF